MRAVMALWLVPLLSALLGAAPPGARSGDIRGAAGATEGDSTTCPAAPPTADAGKYTFVCHADPNLNLPRDTARMAVLIGNTDYAATDTENTRLQSLGLLGPPCDDAKMLAGRLSAVGWRKAELLVLCNQTGREMNDALTALFKVAPDAEADKKFLLFYYAGHGLKIGRKNYLPGVNARVDWNTATTSFIRSAQSQQGFTLFEDYEAVDLYDRLSRFVPKVVFPFLVIVDSCRDNPMVGDAKKAFEAALAKKDHETALRIRGQASVELAGPATNLAKGIEIWYATVAGKSIDDDYNGTGHSHLAAILDEKMKESEDVLRTRQDVSGQLSADEDWLAGQDQTLDKDGDLFEPIDGPPCFGRCRQPTASASAQRASSMVPAVFRVGTPLTPQRQARFASAQSNLAPVPASIWTYHVPTGARPVSLDVFWCSGDTQSSARRADANGFLAKVDAFVNTDDQIASVGVENVRIRELTSAQNAIPGYQRSQDGIYRPAEKVSPATFALAERLRRGTDARLRSVTSRSTSGSYISVFFCRGAFKGSKAPRVYLQVATSDYLTAASGVISYVDRQLPGLDVIRSTQIMAEDPKYPLSKYPPSTVVKYTDDDQAENAAALACTLGTLTGIPIRFYPIHRYKIPHQLEVWIGNREDLGIWRKLSNLGALQPNASARCATHARAGPGVEVGGGR